MSSVHRARHDIGIADVVGQVFGPDLALITRVRGSVGGRWRRRGEKEGSSPASRAREAGTG